MVFGAEVLVGWGITVAVEVSVAAGGFVVTGAVVAAGADLGQRPGHHHWRGVAGAGAPQERAAGSQFPAWAMAAHAMPTRGTTKKRTTTRLVRPARKDGPRFGRRRRIQTWSG